MDKISKFINQIRQRQKKNRTNQLEVADLGNREDIKAKVFSRLKNWESKVFRVAAVLKWPLCFGAPIAAIAFVLLVLICLYNVGPYNTAKRFVETTCSLVSFVFQENVKGKCQYRRVEIMVCSKIWVTYNLTDSSKQVTGVLMEDELANSRCDKCSYTNGLGRLFSTSDTCTWNEEYPLHECEPRYYAMFQSLVNSTFPCYYDPETIGDVIYRKEISSSQIGFQLGLPIVYLLIFLAGLGILIYSRIRRKFIIKELLQELEEKQILNEQARDSDTCKDGLHSVNNDSSNTTIKRTRKKKMPCCRPHNFFDLEEAIVLEQKPISPLHGDQFSSSMNVELQPVCAHHQNTSVGSWGFERIKQNEDELRPVMAVFDETQPSGSRLFRYLPESIV